MKPSAIILCAILFISVSCSKSTPLMFALKNAGDNRVGLEKVLEHYSANPSDSLKYKAAVFLIENMPYHYGVYGDIVPYIDEVFLEMERRTSLGIKLSETEKVFLIDSLLLPVYRDREIEQWMKPDHKSISSDYLIENIDLAFAAWEGAAWKDEVSFSDFCEYILPYRILSEPIDNWRKKLYEKLKNHELLISSNLELNWQFHMKETYPFLNRDRKFLEKISFDMNYKHMDASASGACTQRCAYAIFHLRAIGVPATFDLIPSWGNRPTDHFMVGLATRKQQVFPLFSNLNYSLPENPIIANSMKPYFELYRDGGIPYELYVQYIKTIPKVYRKTWSVQPEMFEILKGKDVKEIDPFFRCLTIKDVTSEFVACHDVSLDLGNQSGKLVYLSVFDINGWKPVVVANVSPGGKVCFPKMGVNVVYLPVMFFEGVTLPVGMPFLLLPNGEMQTFNVDTSILQDFKLIRKYPLFSNIAQFPRHLKGASFEASNSADFKPATLLSRIDYYPFYMNNIEMEHNLKFRYVRLVPPDKWISDFVDIAEIDFQSTENGREVHLTSKPISNQTDSNKYILAFDGNLETYYILTSKDKWLGVDLGMPKKLTKIRFCPRNDANCIIPGNEYELFYWGNKQWNTLGKQMASDDYLIYKSVPTGTLYWLHCHTEGKEERIFTYENGRQIWW